MSGPEQTVPQAAKQYGDPIRSIRVDDELWDAAMTKAAGQGRTISDVVRAALRRYVARSSK